MIFRFLGVSVTFEMAVRCLEGVWGGVCTGRDIGSGICTFGDAITLIIWVKNLKKFNG